MKPYIPDFLPLKTLRWDRFVRLVGQANAALARYDGILQGIINPDVMLSPLTTKEAVLSSRIEGTVATLEEVLEFEASARISEEKKDDVIEIVNYKRALRAAVKYLETHPVSLNMLREIHWLLLDSVRGQDKARGEFRKIQNWIQPPGSPDIKRATYVPPEPTHLMDYLSNLEQYCHYDEEDRLVQLAIIHAQFEIIHPFIDGNGRVGRILVPLFLFEKGLLSGPMFYLSEYLEANRKDYYQRLESISREKDWDSWILFFLNAVVEQAKVNCDKAKSILSLYEQMKREVAQLTRSQFSIQALDTLFYQPIFTTIYFIRRSGIPKSSAMRILSELQTREIIVPLREGRGRRPAILAFPRLLILAN